MKLKLKPSCGKCFKCICLILAILGLVWVNFVAIGTLVLSNNGFDFKWLMKEESSPTPDADYFLPDDVEPIPYDYLMKPTIHYRYEAMVEFMDGYVDICDDLYGFSCGNFQGVENEVLRIVRQENLLIKQEIEIQLTSELVHHSIIPGRGFDNAYDYYWRCKADKSTWNLDRTSPVIARLTEGLGETYGRFYKIRYLIEEGVTNFVHLTKESISGEVLNMELQKTWVHYLRPGGVLFPEKTIHLGLYGEEGLVSYEMEYMRLGEFWDMFPMARPMFGEHAESSDALLVENLEYFENLYELVSGLPVGELNDRLKWYIKHAFQYFDAQSCLDQAKLLFPMSICRTFLRMSTLDDEEDNGNAIAKNVLKAFGLDPRDNPSIRVGGCSSLLHSRSLGGKVIEVENSPIKDFSLDNIQKVLFRGWYKYYDPVYLYFTYPRILEHAEDPLDWYSQTNAFYDSFHNEVVIPPGITRHPVFSHLYGMTGTYSRFGFIVGHEIAHHTIGVNELEADIVGLSKAFSVYPEDCEFFTMYAQLFCSAHPKRTRDFMHATPYERVNTPIKYGSRELIEKFNECFNCILETEHIYSQIHK